MRVPSLHRSARRILGSVVALVVMTVGARALEAQTSQNSCYVICPNGVVTNCWTPCPGTNATGACSNKGKCTTGQSYLQCQASGGTYWGDGSTCQVNCSLSPYTANSAVAIDTWGITPTQYTVQNASNQVVASGAGAPPALTYPVVVDGKVQQPASTYVVGPVANGQTYSISFQGLDTYGRLCKASASATTPGLPLPPSNLKAAASGALALSWTAPDPTHTVVGSYTVRTGTSPTAVFGTALVGGITTTGTTFPLTNFAGRTTYLAVSSVNVRGEGPISTPLTLTLPPLAPTNLAATPSATTIDLTWTPSYGATSYTVFVGTVSGGTFTPVGTSATAAYTISGLNRSTAYYIVVTASGPTGTSPRSAQLATKTTNLAM